MHKETKVFFDVEIDNVPAGRIVIRLYDKLCPKTCENFRQLCTGEAGFSQKTGKLLSYKGSLFHRVIPGFMMQGGDFTKFNGTGSESIYGEMMPDEPMIAKHGKKGTVSMAKNGQITNGSQFFITFAPTPWLDGIHIAFGEVIEGFEVGQKAEKLRTDAHDRPVQRIVISNCGELVEEDTRRRERSRSGSRSYSSSSSSQSRHRKRSRSSSSKKKYKRHHTYYRGKHQKRSRSKDRSDMRKDNE